MTDLPQRPESFNFSLDFLGGSDAAELLAYVEALEGRWQRVRHRTTPQRPVDAMTNLSPAAAAVMDAYINAPCGKPRSAWVAAALEAVADQVVPVSDRPDPSNEFEYGQWLAKSTTRGYLLAIADELEGNAQ